MKKLTVYYASSCAFSGAAASFLVLRGADFAFVNVDESSGLREKLSQRLNGRKLETPTYEVDEQLHVAPKLSELKALLMDWGLPDQAAPHRALRDCK